MESQIYSHLSRPSSPRHFCLFLMSLFCRPDMLFQLVRLVQLSFFFSATTGSLGAKANTFRGERFTWSTTSVTICFISSIKSETSYCPSSICRSFFSHWPVSSADFRSSFSMLSIRSIPVWWQPIVCLLLYVFSPEERFDNVGAGRWATNAIVFHQFTQLFVVNAFACGFHGT